MQILFYFTDYYNDEGSITGLHTTKKLAFYDAHSKTIINNRLRMCHSGIFVIRYNLFCFYAAHSKTIINNRLRMHSVTFL